MDLLIIRHAIAEDRGTFAASGRPDGERPLTERGGTRMEENARGLHAIVPEIAVVGTSPLTRARQTADIVGQVYGRIAVSETDSLAPGADPADFLGWLRDRDPGQTVAAVGHEPDLSELVSWLVTGSPEPFLALKKGGACLLNFHEQIAAGTAEFRWLIPPKLLRRLAPSP